MPTLWGPRKEWRRREHLVFQYLASVAWTVNLEKVYLYALEEAGQSLQAQPELSCFSGTPQTDDLPLLSPLHTNTALPCPAPPAAIANHPLLSCPLPFLVISLPLARPSLCSSLNKQGEALPCSRNIDSKEEHLDQCNLTLPWSNYFPDILLQMEKWKEGFWKWPYVFLQVMSWKRNMGRRAIYIEFTCPQNGKLGLWGCYDNSICLWSKIGKCKGGKMIPGTWLKN